MAPGGLLQLLDEAIGTPEVNVNLEALRKLLKIILGHLTLLGLPDAIPPEKAPEQSHAAGSRPGPQEEEGGPGAEDGALGTGQPGEQQAGEDEQGTRSGPSADMGQTETESMAMALSQEPHRDMAGIKAMESSMGEEIQRIKEALGQTTNLCKHLQEEVNEMKATQSRMGEGIQVIQEALGQGNLQDAPGQPLVLHGQSAPAKPHTSDMDKLGQSPGTWSTTPGIQTGQSSTTGTQPGYQADHLDMESISRALSELQGQMSSLQSLARDLQDEKEKMRQLEEAFGKLGVTVAECGVDGTNQMALQPESALQEIKQEQKKLREEQNITKATLEQLVTADELQEQLNELRAMIGRVRQQPGDSQALSPDRKTETRLVKKLLHRCERLQEQVDSLMPQHGQRSLSQKSQDEELLKSIQATVVRVEGDCEQLSYVTGSLQDDHRQHQKDIEALFRSLEGLEKKADKEELMLLKVDRAALGSKVSCAHFDASMERLEERLQDLLRRVLGQEQRLQEAQQWFSAALDSKLDRLELRPFQKQMEDTWARIIKDLKDELTVEVDDTAGIKQQLLVPYKCLSCDRLVNMQVPGPHIDTLPLFPPLLSSHAAHPSAITTEEQAQQHGHRKLLSSKFLKLHSCRGQSMSCAPKDVLQLSKKPGLTALLGKDDRMDWGQEHRPDVAKRAQGMACQDTIGGGRQHQLVMGPTTSPEHQPASDLKQ